MMMTIFVSRSENQFMKELLDRNRYLCTSVVEIVNVSGIFAFCPNYYSPVNQMVLKMNILIFISLDNCLQNYFQSLGISNQRMTLNRKWWQHTFQNKSQGFGNLYRVLWFYHSCRVVGQAHLNYIQLKSSQKWMAHLKDH